MLKHTRYFQYYLIACNSEMDKELRFTRKLKYGYISHNSEMITLRTTRKWAGKFHL